MSADNWAMCPRCKLARQDAAATAAEKVRAAYGTVDLAAFDDLRAQAVQLADQIDNPPLGNTFREDYEIWGASEGEVFVGYRGGCSTCGLSLTFEHTHPLDVTP